MQGCNTKPSPTVNATIEFELYASFLLHVSLELVYQMTEVKHNALSNVELRQWTLSNHMPMYYHAYKVLNQNPNLPCMRSSCFYKLLLLRTKWGTHIWQWTKRGQMQLSMFQD